MALVTHKFKLDLTPGAARQVLYTSQGDIGRPFEADLYWNGSPWTATGTTASIRGKKPDDTVFDYGEDSDAEVTIDGSKVTFSTTEQMTIISGPVECELVFSNDGDIIASANFLLIVEASPYDPNAISESEVQGLNAMIQAATPEAVDDWFETEAPSSTVFANAVNDATADYIDENGLVIDYDDIEHKIEPSTIIYKNTFEVEQGTFADADGVTKAANVNRCRNVSPIRVEQFDKIVTDNTPMWVFLLDENLQKLGTVGWTNAVDKSTFSNDVAYINFSFQNGDVDKFKNELTVVNDWHVETVKAKALNDENLFIDKTVTYTTGGVTFNNNNGKVTANGTSTYNAIYPVKFVAPFTGYYEFGGKPNDGLYKTYTVLQGINTYDNGEGATVYLNGGEVYTFWCVIGQQYTVTNYVFEPYIRYKSQLKIRFFGISNNDTNKTDLSGQAQVLQFPNGQNMLMDSHLEAYYTGFKNRLVSMGVTHFDYIFVSHYHGDHMGLINIMTQSNTAGTIDIENAVAFLPQEITAQNLASINETERTQLLNRQAALLDILEDNNCTIVRPDEDDLYRVGDVVFRFWNTDHSVYAQTNGEYYSHNYNDWSLCCTLTYGNTRIAFTGDLGPVGERKVGGTLHPVDIMTAPHHGWDNGVNNLVPAFINNLSPKMVVTMNGWEHHPENTSSPANVMLPTSAIQNWCECTGVPNYLTCMNGAIDLIINRQGYCLNGKYSQFIRNGKNWKYVDNSTEYNE